jgi:hypothetical protein
LTLPRRREHIVERERGTALQNADALLHPARINSDIQGAQERVVNHVLRMKMSYAVQVEQTASEVFISAKPVLLHG